MTLNLLRTVSLARQTYDQASAKLAVEFCGILRPVFPKIRIDVGSHPSKKELPELRAELQNYFTKLHAFFDQLQPVETLRLWYLWDRFATIVDVYNVLSCLQVQVKHCQVAPSDEEEIAARFVEHVEVVRKWFDAATKSCEPKLTELESRIMDAVRDCKLTGQQIAQILGEDYNGHVKGVLSSLVKRGHLVNRRPGYEVVFPAESSKSPQSQD
jgi:hypothetical protein